MQGSYSSKQDFWDYTIPSIHTCLRISTSLAQPGVATKYSGKNVLMK